MASNDPASPSQANFRNARRRTNTASSVVNSVASASQSVASFTEDLVLHHDPPPGFFAATAAATARAPSVGEIRRGSFGESGWQSSGSGSAGGRSRRRTRSKSGGEREGREIEGFVEPFAPLSEEPTRMSTDVERAGDVGRVGGNDRVPQAVQEEVEKHEEVPGEVMESTPSTSAEQDRLYHDRTPIPLSKDQRVHSSGYIPPPKVPWTKSTAIGLKAFWRWFLTPFGFLVTIYGLNVVAWGGMLFLLLCNASKYMCWAPIHNKHNQKHLGDIASLKLPGPYYYNCNDINSSRRIWIEIDSQILNALFCVTGFGLVPWRFRDLYYLLRWRFTSEKRYGRERKLYSLRVLAGIHKGWFRLPGSETLDVLATPEYLNQLDKTTSRTPLNNTDLEAYPSALSSLPEHDPRLPLPLSKSPPEPMTSIRAPPTKLWKLDFFVWAQVWNTFFQCCLCGFMWGMDRYTRPPWATGLFIALACGIVGAGGVVSFIDGKKVKKVEGIVPNSEMQGTESKMEEGEELRMMRTDATGHQSVHLSDEGAKEKVVDR